MRTSPHPDRRAGAHLVDPTTHPDRFGLADLLYLLRWCAARLIIHGADLPRHP